jgi:PAS domain-containing protein
MWRLRSSTSTHEDEHARGRIIALLLAAISVFNVSPLALAQTNPPSDYQLKAAFLFNFAKFIDWPNSSFASPQSPFTVCILGQDPFGSVLDDTLKGKTIAGRPIAVRRLKDKAEGQRCQMVFVSASESAHLPEIIGSLQVANVLLVGESNGFARLGGTIELTIEGNYIRFAINTDAADRSGLTVSSKLLALAKIVHDGGHSKGGEMRSHLDLSIRLKLQTIVMVTSAVALLVASIVFTLYDRSTFLRAKTQDLSATATMIGSNSTAALSFGDAKSAREILAALRAKPNVINACIYGTDGRVLATYRRDAAHSVFYPPPAQAQATSIVGHNMVLFQPVTLHDESIGTIFIEADLTDLNERLTRFLEIDFLVLVGSLTVAFLLSSRLQRVISDPIRELADTALSVSTQENYFIRARKRGNDEIGLLFDQFNGMLDRLQQRDVALQRAHDTLEKSVAERTSYLNALIQNSPLGILVLDSEQKVQLCNSAFEKLFEYLRGEVIGKSIISLFSGVEPLLEGHRLALAVC